MSIRFEEQYFTFNRNLRTEVNNVEPNKSKVVASVSTSRKRGEKRVYSDWIVTFWGEAAELVKDLKKGDFLVCSGNIERVPYEDETGKRKWGDGKVNIFEAELWQKKDVVVESPREGIPGYVNSDDNGDIPF